MATRMMMLLLMRMIMRMMMVLITNDTSLLPSLPDGTHRRIVNLFWVNLVSSYEHLCFKSLR